MPKIAKQTPKSCAPVKKTGTLLDRIEDLGCGLDEGIKTLVYGGSGTGKTTFWGTYPKPLLVGVISGGNKPGELRSLDTPEHRKTVKQVVIEKSEDVTGIADLIKNGLEHPGLKMPYRTVVIDHVTALQDLVVKEVGGLVNTPVQMNWGTISQQQWGVVSMQLKERIRSLLSLSINVAIVAQERSFDADSESALFAPCVGAALSPSTTGWLNTACDYIVQTFRRQKTVSENVDIAGKITKMSRPVDGVDYCLRVGPHAVYTTKFRIPKGSAVLPEVIVDPTYDKVLKLIKGGAVK